ncbi:MAG: phage portal protein [Clostridium sp.]|uniref:phage portal protein n=1 Tax=Clostridium sp. TaxID=1506 RepID=UPI003F2A4A43
MGILDYFSKAKFTEQNQLGVVEITNYSFNRDNITQQDALSIPTVVNCRELICSSVSQLPFYLYKTNEDGSIERVHDYREFLVNKNPNDFLNGYNFKKAITNDYLFYGAAYIVPEYKGTKIVSLYPLETQNVTIEKFQDGYKTNARIIYNANGQSTTFFPEDLIRILKDSHDGFTSKGILELNAETLALALEELEYSRNIVKNGAVPSGILTTDASLSKLSVTNLKASWDKLYGGAKNVGKTPVLEGGLKYQQISMKPNDLDLVNSKKTTVAEICKVFNVPESMVNSNANKYASNEANGIQFLQYCMSPVLNAIEEGLDACILSSKEKSKGLFWKADVSELLRTTEKEKLETVGIGIEKRLFTVNEARQKLGLPSIENDTFIYKLGDVFLDTTTNMLTVANTGASLDLGKPQTKEEIAKFQMDLEVEKHEKMSAINKKFAPTPAKSEEPNNGEATEQGGNKESDGESDGKKPTEKKTDSKKVTKKEEKANGKTKPKPGAKK